MGYTVIGDSCTDMPLGFERADEVERVALSLIIDDEEFLDDESFDQAFILEKVKNAKNVAKSACCSPEKFKDRIVEGNDNYIITLSSELSGSYNSAVLAGQMFMEEHPNSNTNIHVFNSKTAASGQALTAMKVFELAEEGKPFAEVVKLTEEYIEEQRTYFLLETLEVFKVNGRVNGILSTLIETLNLKLIMGDNTDKSGTIRKVAQARGMKKATIKMIDLIVDDIKKKGESAKDVIVEITNVNCVERAQSIKEKIMERVNVKDVRIANGRGISTLYACDGGIIVCF